jgi:hypothetical protein
MNNEIQKQLTLTCSSCQATFKLLEIHKRGKRACAELCIFQWQTLLNQHYQEHIILYLAQQEKEADHD